MPRGDKSSYTEKQKRKADHIEEGYERHGVKKKEAERRAWATVNKESGGGNKSGSGRGVKDTKVAAKKGGRVVRAAARRPRIVRRRRALRPPKRRLRPENAIPPRARRPRRKPRRRASATSPHAQAPPSSDRRSRPRRKSKGEMTGDGMASTMAVARTLLKASAAREAAALCRLAARLLAGLCGLLCLRYFLRLRGLRRGRSRLGFRDIIDGSGGDVLHDRLDGALG